MIDTANQFIRDGKYDQAVETIDQILTLDPANDYAKGVRPLVVEKRDLIRAQAGREQFERSLERPAK